MLYTGIDLHKRTVVIATIDETGKVHSEVSLPTSRGVNPKWCLIAASEPVNDNGTLYGIN